MRLSEILYRELKNIPGQKTSRKIAVIYVDDYGSIRIKNKDARNKLLLQGVPMDSNRYSKHDTLASSRDLNMLFEVLTSVKDFNGHYACFTAFANVANPDFEKIKANDYRTYYRTPFTETLKSYGSDYEDVYKLWKQGIAEDIFYPAYHGTEHINVKRFIKALQNGHQSTRFAFDVESVCVPPLLDEVPLKNPTASFDVDGLEDNEQLVKDIEAGLNLFEKLFGYRSKQFTPGTGIYSPTLHKALADNGIKYINVSRYQAYPNGDGTFSKKFLYNGMGNEYEQKYLVRNCVFEPSGSADLNISNNCIKNIEAAFRWGAPAIISTHRVNFVGHFDETWRSNGLMQLQHLLRGIVSKWPDVEFMNGDQMAEEIFK